MVKHTLCDWLQRPSEYDEHLLNLIMKTLLRGMKSYVAAEGDGDQQLLISQYQRKKKTKLLLPIENSLKEAKESTILLVMKQPWNDMPWVSQIKVVHGIQWLIFVHLIEPTMLWSLHKTKPFLMTTFLTKDLLYPETEDVKMRMIINHGIGSHNSDAKELILKSLFGHGT